jgi:hypothetical protein
VRVGGPYEDFDLHVAVGPFVACHLVTAVVWQWTPLHRRRLRLRRSGWASLTATAVTALANPALGAVLAGLTVAWMAMEAFVLWARLGEGLDGSGHETAVSPAPDHAGVSEPG